MKKRGVLWATAVGVALFCLLPLLRAQSSMGDMSSNENEMIGKPAPAWIPRTWVNSPPIQVSQLGGKVIMVRFFGDQPIAAAAVRQFYQAYHPQGLEIVAFYNPQPMPTETDP